MAARKKTADSEVGEAVEQSTAFPYNRTLKFGADGEDVPGPDRVLGLSGEGVALGGDDLGAELVEHGGLPVGRRGAPSGRPDGRWRIETTC